MRKKIISGLIIAMLMLVSFAGCGSKEDSPKDIVSKFMEAGKKFDVTEMASCMLEDDGTTDVFTAKEEEQKKFLEFFAGYNTATKIDVIEEKIDDSKASVKVNASYNNIENVVEDIMSQYIVKYMQLLLEKGEDALNQDKAIELFTEILEENKNVKTDTLTTALTFSLEKKDGKWKIVSIEDMDDLINVLTCNGLEMLSNFSFTDD